MYTLDYKKYKEKIRQICAESCVLIKNDNALPIKQEEKVSLFGRSQIETYYCGTGSGGMVNIPYLVSIVDGISSKRTINKDLLNIYEDFIKENPFDKGKGWAMEPFSQVEMTLTENIVKKASEVSDIAIMVIGRLAGEDKDCLAQGGSYYLSDTEKQNLKLIKKHFTKCVVMLNIGGVMDMSFIDELNPDAVMIAWHGGVESGNGYADVLCGDVNPCGALPDSIAKTLADYPSSDNFGSDTNNIYKEDIFVGYRYFNTFCEDKILYPFGHSLSYSNFEITVNSLYYFESNVRISFTIKNIGNYKGKKIVQLYASAPFDNLCKPQRVLCSFVKSEELQVGQSQDIELVVENSYFASFDENACAFVLEKGQYTFHIGFDSLNTKVAGAFTLDELVIVEKVNDALAPIDEFKRLESSFENGKYSKIYKKAPTRSYNVYDRIIDNKKNDLIKTDNNYTFDMVKSGEITVEQFANDLSDLEIIHLTRGEGMCSPKVTSGTASAFGGVTKNLNKVRKIPIACCADGPSGIRMDSGTMAMSIPNGTALASTFNEKACEELMEFVAIEMVKNNIDTLLGPGMNIHRNPLCGRNFEYFSEDPLLSGKMASAQLKALHKYGVTGTIKHFAGNNQEFERKIVNSTISQRALREIYLKGFEIAVKEGKAYSLMTAYNPINCLHCASNYDLNTTVLRKDWGYDGVVMTDWWATMNKEREFATINDTASMIISQNDVYMVTMNSEQNALEDNSETELLKGNLTRYDLVRTAKNILSVLLRFNCSKEKTEVNCINVPKNTSIQIHDVGDFEVFTDTNIDCTSFNTTRGVLNKFNLAMKQNGRYALDFELYADAPELAQVPMTVSVNSQNMGTVSLKGANKGNYHVEFDMYASINVYVDLFFGEGGMVMNSLKVSRVK